MDLICREAETEIYLTSNSSLLSPKPTDINEGIAFASVNAARNQQVGSILLFSSTGTTPQLVSKFRPNVPIFVITRNESIAHQVILHRGCIPFYWKGKFHDETLIQHTIERAKEMKYIQTGQIVIIILGKISM